MKLPTPPQEAIMGILPMPWISESYREAFLGCVQAGWVTFNNGKHRLTEAGEVAWKQGLQETIR